MYNSVTMECEKQIQKSFSSADTTSRSGFLNFIAYLQIIGIILVVFGHSFHEYPDGKQGFNLVIYRMMYSFRMPLFMFVSGFLMVYTAILKELRLKWSRFAIGKVKRLMIPFVVLTLITFVPRSMMSDIADDSIELSLHSVFSALYDHDHLIIPFFWFLQSSFTLLLLVSLYLTFTTKLRIKDVYSYSLLIIIFAFLYSIAQNASTFFSLIKTCEFGIFFVLGCAYCRWSQNIDKFIKWDSPILFVVFATVWAILFYYCEYTEYMIFCSIAGIAMCISFAKMLVRYDLHFLDHLVGANYIIFLLSWYCNIASQQVLHHFVELPWWVYSILSLVSGIYVPWLFYRYMLNHPQSRWTKLSKLLLGQSFKHSK